MFSLRVRVIHSVIIFIARFSLKKEKKKFSKIKYIIYIFILDIDRSFYHSIYLARVYFISNSIVYPADGIKKPRDTVFYDSYDSSCCSTLNLFGNVYTRTHVHTRVRASVQRTVRRYFAIVKLVTYTLRGIYTPVYTRSIALPRKKLNVLHVRAAAPATLTFRV